MRSHVNGSHVNRAVTCQRVTCQRVTCQRVYKTNPMDIVKAFNTNDLHTEIVIKGTLDDPLFRASDIGVVLDITTIHSVIRDFDESEKVLHTMQTLGGSQDVTFLTEKGLYKVLFRSRKPIAQKFQNWVCEVIKEIRLKGIYKMQTEINKAI